MRLAGAERDSLVACKVVGEGCVVVHAAASGLLAAPASCVKAATTTVWLAAQPPSLPTKQLASNPASHPNP
jgi:hypothetical protein